MAAPGGASLCYLCANRSEMSELQLVIVTLELEVLLLGAMSGLELDSVKV